MLSFSCRQKTQIPCLLHEAKANFNGGKSEKGYEEREGTNGQTVKGCGDEWRYYYYYDDDDDRERIVGDEKVERGPKWRWG